MTSLPTLSGDVQKWRLWTSACCIPTYFSSMKHYEIRSFNWNPASVSSSYQTAQPFCCSSTPINSCASVRGTATCYELSVWGSNPCRSKIVCVPPPATQHIQPPVKWVTGLFCVWSDRAPSCWPPTHFSNRGFTGVGAVFPPPLHLNIHVMGWRSTFTIPNTMGIILFYVLLGD